MTTVIECHPPVSAKIAAASKAPRNTTVNGVDAEKLSATIAAIKADASLANFQFRLSNRWVGGGENHSRIASFYGVGREMQHKQPFSSSATNRKCCFPGTADRTRANTCCTRSPVA